MEYLLVGSGAASYYAALAIRARHADAKVLMVITAFFLVSDHFVPDWRRETPAV